MVTDLTAPKQVHLRFLLSPTKFLPSEDDPTVLGAVQCERTRLDGDVGHQKCAGTGELETLPAQLALVSIGYKGVSISGIEPWFDEQHGVLHNQHGRVDSGSAGLGGLYTSGWLKRGPSGIIGTNIPDAKDTVTSIMSDLESVEGPPVSNESLSELLRERKVAVVRWEDYRNIEEAEIQARRSDAQPREKITNVQDQLRIARQGA